MLKDILSNSYAKGGQTTLNKTQYPLYNRQTQSSISKPQNNHIQQQHANIKQTSKALPNLVPKVSYLFGKPLPLYHYPPQDNISIAIQESMTQPNYTMHKKLNNEDKRYKDFDFTTGVQNKFYVKQNKAQNKQNIEFQGTKTGVLESFDVQKSPQPYQRQKREIKYEYESSGIFPGKK